MKANVILKKLEPADLPKIAAVHMSSFPDSALTKLGASIVERYYLWHLTGPHKRVVATGAFIGDECVGFSFSGIFNGSVSGFIKKNKISLIKGVLMNPQHMLDPIYLGRIRTGVKLLRRFSARNPIASCRHKSETVHYGIVSIAVSRDHQKEGIGQILILDAQEQAIKFGHQMICLTVNPENEQAIRFYEKQNWQKMLQNGLWKGAMIKDLR
ncbi:MAG: GNAT family N-acetyltransferase [Pyrinomonadaceae bacterium]